MHVIDSLHVGGAEQAMRLLVQHTDPARFSCRVFALRALGPLAGDLERSGMLANRAVRAGLWRQLVDLYRYLRQTRPHVVHTHLNYSDLFGGAIARAARVPVVVSYKSSILRTHGRRQRVYDVLTRWSARHNDAVVVLSEALRIYLVEHRIVPASKVRVIRYGVPQTIVSRALSRSDLGLTDGPIILLPARLEPRKDHPTFLAAAALVRTHIPGAQFLLAGGGAPAYRAELERIAASLSSPVRFLGERQDIPALMELSDVIVLSSRTEGLGLVLLEAMERAKPVVATAVGGVPEVVVSGETGQLVPAGDPSALAMGIVSVLSNIDAARRMGQAGRRRVETEFAAEGMARRMETLYGELLAARAVT